MKRVAQRWPSSPIGSVRAFFLRSAPAEAGSPAVADWKKPERSGLQEFGEVLLVLGFVTVAGWFVPLSYHAFGHIYLLAVIALSLRVTRGPVLAAAVISAVAWNYVFIPPRMSFAVVDFDDGLLLATYFIVALVGSQLTSRMRSQARTERKREQQATALLELTHALASSRTLDEAVAAALRQSDKVFEARTALLLADQTGTLRTHLSNTFELSRTEDEAARRACQLEVPTGRFTPILPHAESLCLPMLRPDGLLGVLALRFPRGTARLSAAGRDLISGFAAQIALLIEREKLRSASERESLLAEADRLHRTLFDSVSHELKTPLSVLRSASEKMDTSEPRMREGLTAEMRQAVMRLDHLVANLLSQSRLESGTLRPHLDWCEVRDIVAAARRAAGAALIGRTLSVEISPDMPLFMADAPLMEEVLSNLLLNAARHTPRECRIRVAARFNEDTRAIRIAVSDEGPGIPPELKPVLFQKFQRGNAPAAGGLGLGLSIVRGFMEAQGGSVCIKENSDGGACFVLELPHVDHDSVPNDEH